MISQEKFKMSYSWRVDIEMLNNNAQCTMIHQKIKMEWKTLNDFQRFASTFSVKFDQMKTERKT